MELTFDSCDDSCDESQPQSVSETTVGEGSRVERKVVNKVPDYVVKREEKVGELPTFVKQTICSRGCNYGCNKNIESLKTEDVEELKDTLNDTSSIISKNKVLNYLKIVSMSHDSYNYYFSNSIFCVQAFSHLSGVSVYILSKVIKDLKGGRTVDYTAVRGGKSSNKKTNFVAWMIRFSETYGQFSPTKPMILLPKIMLLKCLFDVYKSECIKPIVKRSMFYKLFKDVFGAHRKDKTFPHIRISKYSTHSKCDECVSIEEERSRIKTKQDKFRVNKRVEAHRRVFGGARQAIAKKLQYCVSFPRDCLGISMDDMDQHKSNLPHVVEPGKKLSKLIKLDTKITGVIQTSGLYEKNRKVRFHYNHGQFEQGSNKVVSMLYNNIIDFYKEHKFLPPKLFLNLDNCWRENKNQFMLAFLYFLVEIGVFEEVEFMLLIVGHTGNHVDQLFSILAQLFKTQEIRTIEDLVFLMENSVIKPKPEVEELEYIWDWKAAVTPQLTGKMTNHSIPHAFQFKKEDGVTKFRSKLLPQDSKYREDAGMRILKPEAKHCIKYVSPANFKIQDLSLDEIGHDYCNKFVTSLDDENIRRNCLQSWDRLRDKLEKLPRRQKNLPKMDVTSLPRQDINYIEEYSFEDENEPPGIGGIEAYPEDLGALKVDDDVAIYNDNKAGRPWVARVIEIVSSDECVVQWFEKKSQMLIFKPMKLSDGSPYQQSVQRRSIMFIGIGAKYNVGDIRLTPYWRNKIMEEYDRLDSVI